MCALEFESRRPRRLPLADLLLYVMVVSRRGVERPPANWALELAICSLWCSCSLWRIGFPRSIIALSSKVRLPGLRSQRSKRRTFPPRLSIGAFRKLSLSVSGILFEDVTGLVSESLGPCKRIDQELGFDGLQSPLQGLVEESVAGFLEKDIRNVIQIATLQLVGQLVLCLYDHLLAKISDSPASDLAACMVD